MSTDKLQALSNTVAGILKETAAPPTYFDEEPREASKVDEAPAQEPGQRRRTTDAPSETYGTLGETFGKLASRKPGIAPDETREVPIDRDAANDSVQIVREALAGQLLADPDRNAGHFLKKPSTQPPPDSAKAMPDSKTAQLDAARSVEALDRTSRGRWAMRGVAAVLLAIGVGVAGVSWLGARGDAAKTAPSQPAALAQPLAATPPEPAPLLQSMARDVASMGREIEQLKAGREALIRDNANLSEQLRGSQEQLTRAVAALSDQLRASREQTARDSAAAGDQIKAIREQLDGITSRATELNAPPGVSATASRQASSAPRRANGAARNPVTPPSAAQASAAKPKPVKPKPPSAPRSPSPVQ